MAPTFVPILRNEKAITIDYNLWGSYIAQDLLKNLSASTYVLITDTNLYDLYVPSFEKAFNHVASSLGAESRLLTYTISPGETSKSRRTKAEVEDWMLSEERDPPLDVSLVPSQSYKTAIYSYLVQMEMLTFSDQISAACSRRRGHR